MSTVPATDMGTDPQIDPHIDPSAAAQGLGTGGPSLQHLQVLSDLERWPDVLAHAASWLARGDEPQAFALVLNAHHMQGTLGTAQAQHTLGRARQLWPAGELWAFFAAHQALELGLLARAEQEARAGLAQQPSAAYLHTCLAQVLAAGQHWAGAARALDQSLALQPSSAHAHTERARMAHNLQQRPLALRHVQQALRLEPGHAHALALLAALQGPVQPGRAKRLLGQALRAMPMQAVWQRQWRDVGLRWWLDVALAVLGCLLTLSCQSWVWAGMGLDAGSGAGSGALAAWMPLHGLPLWWSQAVLGFNALLAWSWLGRVQRIGLLWPFAYAQALCWGADLPTSLPQRWLHAGPAALLDWETMAYLGGSLLIAALGVAVLGLVRVAGTEPLRLCAEFVCQGWRAQREQRGLAWLQDVAQRPAVHFNALVGALALAISGPWLNVAMGSVAWIFIMPLGVWMLAARKLPVGQRPAFPLVFWLLGMVPGLATFVGAGSVGLEAVAAAPGWHVLWACACAAYAMLQVNSLRQA